MSLGEDRVRKTFNPSANMEVEDIKQRAADCINWCENRRNGAGDEKARLLSLAQTAFEEAAMWAVKAVTG